MELRWAGLGAELRLFTQAWRGLPDNPLWVMRQRQRANADPVRPLAARSRLLPWGVIGLLVYAFVAWQVTEEYAATNGQLWVLSLTYFVAGPFGALFLYCSLQLAQRAQSWLAVDRFEARRSGSTLLDPLLGMAPFTASEVVAAALRDLAPLILASSSLAALTTVLMILGKSWSTMSQWGPNGQEEFMTALVYSPLTLVSLLLVGCLGGCLLMLVFFCVGLGQQAPAQRGGWTFAAVAHQVIALPLSFGYLSAGDYNDHSRQILAAFAMALGLMAGAVAIGTRLAFRGRRIRPGWLAGFPAALAVIGICSLYLTRLVAGYGYQPHYEGMPALTLQCLSWWSSLSLASPGCVPLVQCYGVLHQTYDMQWFTVVNYVLTVLVQLSLILGAYRCALFCAARRLRAGA